MEDALVLMTIKQFFEKFNLVLILVLMEDALVRFYLFQSQYAPES